MEVIGFTGSRSSAPNPVDAVKTSGAGSSGSGAGSSGSGTSFLKMCSACGSNPANAGRAWCERCYTMAKAQKH